MKFSTSFTEAESALNALPVQNNAIQRLLARRERKSAYASALKSALDVQKRQTEECKKQVATYYRVSCTIISP